MPKTKTITKLVCGMCSGDLTPGVAHVCPNAQKVTVAQVDWKWWLAFALQFIVLIGTMLWKGGQLSQDLQYMKLEQEKEQKRLESIEKYFQRPYQNSVSPSDYRSQ